jgi:hypothetical protein
MGFPRAMAEAAAGAIQKVIWRYSPGATDATASAMRGKNSLSGLGTFSSRMSLIARASRQVQELHGVVAAHGREHLDKLFERKAIVETVEQALDPCRVREGE